MSIIYESLNEYDLRALGSGAEGIKMGWEVWLVDMNEAEIPGAAIGWCLWLLLSLATGIKAGQMGTAVIICKRLCHKFYEGLWQRK